MDTQAKHAKILIVDDEADLANLYKLRLVREGYEVEHCIRGDTALQMARSFRPDLILLDLMMPNLSGFDAIELFRGTSETSGTKIIILSALSQPDDIEKTKRLGADGYLVKSDVTLEEVVVFVNTVLNEPVVDGVVNAANTPPTT